MEFKIRNTFPYKRCEIKFDNTTVDLGLLSGHESQELAAKLIDAASDLMYNVDDEIQKELSTILENLRNT